MIRVLTAVFRQPMSVPSHGAEARSVSANQNLFSVRGWGQLRPSPTASRSVVTAVQNRISQGIGASIAQPVDHAVQFRRQICM